MADGDDNVAAMRARSKQLDTEAQGLVNQATINRGEDVPGPNGPKGRKGFRYASPEDQKDYESYAKNVSDSKRVEAATLRRQANETESRANRRYGSNQPQ